MRALWAIVPLHRRADLPNVLANLYRQQHKMNVCVVENGGAIGACKQMSTGADFLVLNSTEHQSVARNVALEAIRHRGGGFFFTLDADDWYGPGYLSELLANRHKADFVGKRRHLVLLPDGLYLFDARSANRPTKWLHGACIAGQAEDAIDFPIVRVGEEQLWAEELRKRGYTFYATSARNYVYNHLGNQHTWNPSETLFKKCCGPGFKLGTGGQPQSYAGPTQEDMLKDLEDSCCTN